MKKSTIILIVIFVLYIVSSQMLQFHTAIFIYRNLLVFSFMSLLAYRVINYFSKYFFAKSKSEKHNNIIIISRTLTFILSLIIIFNVQMLYIEKNAIPYEYTCEYYDQYNNLVYENLYYGLCTDIDVVTQTDSTFIFTVREDLGTLSNYNDISSLDLHSISDTGSIKVISLSDVVVEYDDTGRITEYDIKYSINIEYSVDDIVKIGSYSYHRNVVNSYENSRFETTSESAYSSTYDTESTFDNLIHFNFNEDEYTIHYIYRSYEDLDSSLSIDYNLIREIDVPGNEPSTRIIAEVELEEDMDILYTNKAPEDFKSIKVSTLDDYIFYKSYMISSSNLTRLYSYMYELNDDGLYYIYSSDDGFENQYSYFKYTDFITNEEVLANENSHYYKIIDTDYGTKVTEMRLLDFDYFTDNEEYIKDRYLIDINKQYEYIENYYTKLFEANSFEPQVIINGLNELIK